MKSLDLEIEARHFDRSTSFVTNCPLYHCISDNLKLYRKHDISVGLFTVKILDDLYTIHPTVNGKVYNYFNKEVIYELVKNSDDVQVNELTVIDDIKLIIKKKRKVGSIKIKLKK